MSKLIQKILQFIFDNYFALIAINALILLVNQKIAVFEYIIFPLAAWGLFLIRKKEQIKTNILDLLVGAIIILMATTWIINDYEHKIILILRCIFSQISFMLFYYIGRIRSSNNYSFFEKSYIPLFICCIIGIWWFFSPPAFYLNNIYEREDFNGYNFLELARLKSIFLSPYHISYMCSFMSIYMVYKLTNKNLNNKRHIFYLLIYILTMTLAMMRAPILIFILSSLFLYTLSVKKININKVCKTLFFITLVFIGLYSILSNYLDLDNMSYLISKFNSIIENSDELVEGRLNLGYKFDFIGDGAGRHAIYANRYNSVVIADSEYIKILVEQGYIGIVLYALILIIAIIKCLRHIHQLNFELCIIMFFTITMIGANSLSTADKHCFIFWYVLGIISSFKSKRYDKNFNNYSHV